MSVGQQHADIFVGFLKTSPIELALTRRIAADKAPPARARRTRKGCFYSTCNQRADLEESALTAEWSRDPGSESSRAGTSSRQTSKNRRSEDSKIWLAALISM
jgi:hypothetical protein